jgi:hypothetical protein
MLFLSINNKPQFMAHPENRDCLTVQHARRKTMADEATGHDNLDGNPNGNAIGNTIGNFSRRSFRAAPWR